MSFIDDIKNRAKKCIKTIILTESKDVRVLEAASKVTKKKIKKIILIGNENDAITLTFESIPEVTETFKVYILGLE